MSDWRRPEQLSLREEAQSENTLPERLSELATKGVWVEAAVAKNPRTPRETLERLAQNSAVQTWLALLQNQRLPASCFLLLSQQEKLSLRKALARCPRTPPEILATLARLRRQKLLVLLAKNQSTPPEVLQELSSHRLTGVYRTAQENPKNPLYVEGKARQRFARDSQPATNAPTPRLLIEQFLSSGDPATRAAVARNPFLPVEVMQRLVLDGDVFIRVALARNRSLPNELIKRLFQDAPEVRNALSTNPSAVWLFPASNTPRGNRRR